MTKNFNKPQKIYILFMKSYNHKLFAYIELSHNYFL